MSEKSIWTVRQMNCPEEKRKASLLMEWRIQKGKKVLHSISCDHPQLRHYGGEDCGWVCMEEISRKKR